jgi:hypothetical protein
MPLCKARISALMEAMTDGVALMCTSEDIQPCLANSLSLSHTPVEAFKLQGGAMFHLTSANSCICIIVKGYRPL